MLPAPALVRLFMLAVVAAVAPDTLREPFETGGLCGLTPVRWTADPLLPTPGGSGRGRDMEMVLLRFTGDGSRVGARGTTGIFCPVMNSCLIASSGRSRRSGSHRKQRARKSTKASSSHLRTCCNVLDEGRRLRPLDDTVNRGLPMESKNSFFLVLFSIRCFSGGPNTSMMHASCSCSFSPGKMGTPVYNSAKIQPTLHISMGIP